MAYGKIIYDMLNYQTMKVNINILLSIISVFASCREHHNEAKTKSITHSEETKNDTIQTTKSIKSDSSILYWKHDTVSQNLQKSFYDSILMYKPSYINASLSQTERAMANAGLVDVHDIMPQVQLDLRYATTNNFVGEILYPDTKRCFLRIETIVKLHKALTILHKTHPQYTFIIYDGARPQHIQARMYEIAKAAGKSKYVARPDKGGMHNFGVAIDIGIYDLATESIVDMGTDFDYFGEEAQPRFHAKMLAAGKLTNAQIANRTLLKNCMRGGGFSSILTEWWHFEAYQKEFVRSHFPIVP